MSNLLTGDFPTKTYRNINLGVTGVVIKAAKGQIFGGILCNNASAARFVKLYDKVTAPTTSDTPTQTIELQANQTLPLQVGQGIEYLLGIGIRASNLVADNDNTAPSTNDVVVNIFWL